MIFKDIKPNHTVYILNQQEITLTKGKITNVSFPYIRDTRNPNQPVNNPYPAMNLMNSERVIDVTIDMEGRSATYSIPEGLSVAYANNLVISTDLEGITKELQAMNGTSSQFLSTVDQQKEYHQNVFDRTSKILSDIDPASKERQAIDQRFSNLESNMKDMRENIQDMSKSITAFLNEFKSPNK